MNNIFEPLTLSSGSHQAGSGKGCAMNVISWENGDTTITDYPACSDRMLSSIVQGVNDALADSAGVLSPENSIIALDLGHATVGTTGHELTDLELRQVYVRCAVLAARRVLHLDTSGKALPAIVAAERWADDPTQANAAATAATTATTTAAAASYAAATAATTATTTAAATTTTTAAAAAAASYASAYASAAYAYAASYAASFRIDLAWEIIDLFKGLTGTISPQPVPEVTALAVEKMLAHN